MNADTMEAVLKRRFRLDQAPTLAAHTPNAPVAFSRLKCDRPHPGLAGPVPPEDSFALQVTLQPIRSWELRTNRGVNVQPAAKPGDVFLFDLSENPRVNWCEPFDVVRFYISRAALDTMAYERGAQRTAGLRMPEAGSHDPVMHGMALALSASLARPQDAPSLFVDHMALAFHAHAVQAYGGAVRTGRSSGGLAPWQMRRVRDVIEATLDGDHTISQLAAECGLSSSHFTRAFKHTTGLAPHNWLTRKRVERARTLLAETDMAQTDIALACGFADQSHFCRVFARLENQSPGRWRHQHARNA